MTAVYWPMALMIFVLGYLAGVGSIYLWQLVRGRVK